MRTAYHRLAARLCPYALGSSLAVVCLASPAQGRDPIYPWAVFGGVCRGSSIELTLSGEDDGQHADVTGFDIVRHRHGVCGDETIRVTSTPIPRVFGQPFELHYVDEDVADDVLYYYEAYGVDSQRTTRTSLYTVYWMPGGNEATYAGCGRTLAGHGTLLDEGGGWLFQPCPGSCFSTTWVEPWLASLAPFVGTGTPVALYGGFGWTVEGHWMIVEDFEIVPCTTAVEGATWGEVKRLYH